MAVPQAEVRSRSKRFFSTLFGFRKRILQLPSSAERDSHPSGQLFEYRSLRTQPQEIRLLKWAGEPSAFELHHVSFENPPAYVTLSYHWGDPTPRQHITCNGRPAMISENLMRALDTVFSAVRKETTALWEKGEDIYLWADGLCINQQDVNEKNIQVALMGEIYGRAKGAVGYIGAPPAGGIPEAPFLALAWQADAFVDKQDDIPEKVTENGSTGLGDLWANQWFMRSWVTQEVVLSKIIICLYGSGSAHTSTDFNILSSLIYMCQHADHVRKDWFKAITSRSDYEAQMKHGKSAVQVHSWGQLREQRKGDPEGLDLIKILDRIRPADATDKRDKVYSILGLLKKRDREAIRVSYSDDHTAQQVYVDLAKYCLSTPYAVRLLEHAGTSRKLANLPSWVPDWSCYPRYPLDSRLYRCAGNTTPRAHLSSDGRKVLLPGLTFDKIIVLGVPISYPDGNMDTPMGQISSPKLVDIALEEMAYQMYEQIRSRFGRYPANEDRDDVIWRTLTADRGWGDRRSTPEDRRFYKAFRAENPGRAYAESVPPAAQVDASQMPPSAPFSIMTGQSQHGRVLCTTRSGRLGVVPGDAKPGDWIAVFPGGNLPFVIRNIRRNEFLLVGHCYVHGVMDGEVITALERTPGLLDACFKELVLL